MLSFAGAKCSRDLFVGAWWTDPATAATGRDVELLPSARLSVSTRESSVRASVSDDRKDRCCPTIPIFLRGQGMLHSNSTDLNSGL